VTVYQRRCGFFKIPDWNLKGGGTGKIIVRGNQDRPWTTPPETKKIKIGFRREKEK
jgi:hypothetical protein